MQNTGGSTSLLDVLYGAKKGKSFMETMGTGSFPGIKRPGRGVDHPPPSSAEVKERVELYLYSLWALMACSRVTFTCTLYGKHACPSVRGLVSAATQFL